MQEIRIYYEEAFPSDLDAVVRRNLCLYLPAGAETFKNSRSWRGSSPFFSVVSLDDGDVTGHVGVVDRRLRVGGTECRAAGVQNVFVRPPERGTGLSAMLLGLAMREAEARGFDFGLLFCKPQLAKVYTPMGWQRVEGGDTVVTTADGCEQLFAGPGIVMFFQWQGAAFPDGTIHLCGDVW